MSDPGHILLFRQSSLGDVILTLPVIRALRNKFPRISIEYLTKSAYAPIIENQPGISRIITFEDNSSFSRAIRMVRAEKYELFIDLQANFRSMLLRAALFPVKTLQYKKRRFAREMVVRRSGLKLKIDHTVSAYFHPLTRLGIVDQPEPPALIMDSSSADYARKFIENSPLSTCRRIVAFCPGARHDEKKWPYENYMEVARRLLLDSSTGVIVISSSSDNLPHNQSFDHDRLLQAVDLDIKKVASLLSGCRIALTNDSGLMHLANAVGTPVMAIFGPTNPRLGFAPMLPGSKILCDDVRCSPCSVHGQKPCRQPVKYCFENITPERVVEGLMEIF